VYFPPFEINLGKSEIIRALNSSIKVKICGEDLLLTQDLLLKPIIISDPCAFAFFLVTLINRAGQVRNCGLTKIIADLRTFVVKIADLRLRTIFILVRNFHKLPSLP